MGPKVKKAESKEKKCTRCLKSFTGESDSLCTVDHPQHLQLDMGASYGPKEIEKSFYCQACDRGYTIMSEGRDYAMVNGRVVQGPRWCYSGQHTFVDIPSEDKRRNYGSTLVVLKADGDVQEKIDALPETNPDVTTLIIAASGLYDENINPKLCVKLAKLEEVQLIDCAFAEITLNEQLTPNLRRVQMKNVPDSCKLNLSIPNLTHFTIYYFNGDAKALQIMLDKATKLEKFDSYKLWCFDHISFASNHLTDINLHRSDSLRSIDLWAPRLEDLNLQACYALKSIRIKDTYPILSGDLPPGFQPTMFGVSAVNAVLDPHLVRYLTQHPRVILEYEDGSDEQVGNPMEAFFKQMHAPAGSDWDNRHAAFFRQIQEIMGGLGGATLSSDDEFDHGDDESEAEEN